MVKHTQTIRRQVIDEMFKCFDHFVKLAIKGLSHNIALCIWIQFFKKKLKITIVKISYTQQEIFVWL